MKKCSFTKLVLCFIGISGAFSVLFGAWLAHGGQSLSAELQFRLANALQYQVIHTLALLSLVVLLMRHYSKLLVFIAYVWMAGMMLFSGSLYLKTMTGIVALSKVAPFGGMLMATGWLLLIPFSLVYLKPHFETKDTKNSL